MDSLITYTVKTGGNNIEDLRVQVLDQAGKPVWYKERRLYANEIVELLVDVASGRTMWTIHKPVRGWYIHLRSPLLPPRAFIPLSPLPSSHPSCSAYDSQHNPFHFTITSSLELKFLPPTTSNSVIVSAGPSSSEQHERSRQPRSSFARVSRLSNGHNRGPSVAFAEPSSPPAGSQEEEAGPSAVSSARKVSPLSPDKKARRRSAGASLSKISIEGLDVPGSDGWVKVSPVAEESQQMEPLDEVDMGDGGPAEDDGTARPSLTHDTAKPFKQSAAAPKPYNPDQPYTSSSGRHAMGDKTGQLSRHLSKPPGKRSSPTLCSFVLASGPTAAPATETNDTANHKSWFPKTLLPTLGAFSPSSAVGNSFHLDWTNAPDSSSSSSSSSLSSPSPSSPSASSSAPSSSASLTARSSDPSRLPSGATLPQRPPETRSPLRVLSFEDKTRWLEARTSGVLTIDQALVRAVGIEKGFWIAVALAYLEYLEEKEGYAAAADG